MKAKWPTPPECPICTSREVFQRGHTGIKIIDNKVIGTGAGRKLSPKPKNVRYRCNHCGHKFTTSA